MTATRSRETPAALLARAAAEKAAHPTLRTRELAARIGVSEAELLDARVGSDVVRLRADLPMLLERLPAVGRVMTLTRNDGAVHERRGSYNKGSVHGHVGLVVGEEIDLRLFPAHWVAAYRVTMQAGNRTLDSIQVFDGSGTAVEKIYAEGKTDTQAWEALITDLKDEDQSPGRFTAVAVPKKTRKVPADSFDSERFLEAWGGLTDTHQFHMMLRKFGVAYGDAFEAAEGRFTRRLPVTTALPLLEQASKQQIPIMVFVGNRGCIQIHTGPVRRILGRNGWTNVLDPDFNLHLKEELVASAWAVSKPTVDGAVSSVELLDAHGEVIVRFFGARKPGKAELPAWRALVQALSSLPIVTDNH